MLTGNKIGTGILYPVFVCLFLGSAVLCAGQEYLLDTRFYGMEEGLSHRDVDCIQQDKQGFIWLGTNYGLNRFDGYNFKWFTREKHGLQSNTINHLLRDDRGLLWLINTTFRVYQAPQSIDLFDPVTEEVRSFEETFGNTAPFDIHDVTSFCGAPDGTLAFVTKQNKLVVFTHEKGFTVSDLKVSPFLAGMFSRHHTLWGYSSKNDPTLKDVLVELDLQGNVIHRYEHDYPFQYNYIGGVDEADNLWYLSKYWYGSRFETKQPGRIFQITPDGVEHTMRMEETALPPGSVNLDIPAFANKYGFWTEPRTGTFWLFGEGSLQAFHPASGWRRELIDLHLSLSKLNTIFFDNKNRIWIGTEFGLHVFELNKNPFESLAHDPEGKATSSFRGITEDGNQTVWACIDTGRGWMAHARRLQGRYKTEISDWANARWGKGYKYGIFTDRKGFVWFGSGEDSILVKVDPQHGTSQAYPCLIPRRSKEQQVNLWSLFEDDREQIWFGTDAGRIGYLQEGSPVQALPELEGVNEKGGCIYQFHSDKKGNTWLTTDNGLFRLDLAQHTASPFQMEGMPFLRESILHLYEDEDGSFWLGTRGLGLFHWQPGTKEYQQFTKADGLSNNTIYAVYDDGRDNLWLPSDYGIIRFNKTTHRSRAYLEKDGISNKEFNRISHYQSKSGKLFFGSLNGITAFDPRQISGDSLAAGVPLVITNFELFDGDQDKLVNKTASLRSGQTITLRPSDRFFRIEFALLSYLDVDNIQYAYRMDGVDKDWIYQKENSLRFSGLPYGRHLLRIKGQASNGQWSENELGIEICVLKPLYLRPWFLAVALLALIGGAVLFYKLRVKNLKAQRDKLERVVAERTEKISRDKKIIEQQAEALKSLENLKSRFFANISHELRTPLTLMLGPVESLLKRKEGESEESRLLQFVQRNARQLHNLINEILDLSKLEHNKMEVTEEPVHFHGFMKEQIAQFYSACSSNQLNFQWEFQADESLVILLDKGKFEKILHNFLSNALKFTPVNGSVKVLVRDLGEDLQVSVRDSGRGIHPNDLPHIFDRFYQSKQPDAPTEGGTGIGLSLVRELSGLLGGEVWAESDPGKGSCFYFKFPKKTVAGNPEAREEQDPEIFLKPGVLETVDSFPMPPPDASTTILIVEDNPDLQEYLRYLLSGYRVRTAGNGAAALECLEQHGACDLIISDLMMPVMDGFQLLDQLKADDRWRHLPVIMLTAKVNQREKLRALRIGVDDYLTKPFVEEELKARIENLLRNYRERMALFSKTDHGVTRLATDTPVMAAVDTEWLQQVEQVFLQYIADSRLTVDFAADKLHLSERQFHRRLKQLTGLAPNKYLQEIRLQQAREVLTEGRFSTVKEVCFSVGFNDQRYFSDLFEKQFGVKPSEIRK